MRRRGFFALAAGAVVLAGCGGEGAPAGAAVDRLFLLEPAADGHGWDGIARRLASVLVRSGLARTVMAVERPGVLGSAPRDAFVVPGAPGLAGDAGDAASGASGASGVSFAREGRLLVTAMPMVAAAEIANTAAVVEAATPLARLAGDWTALVVPAGSRLRAFEDLAAALHRDPAGLTVGGRLEGGSDHVLYGMIGKCLGVDTRLLEYAGYLAAADAAEALRVGRVAAMLGSARALLPAISAGRLRPLAVSSGGRIEGIDAPTLMELGVRLEYSDWCGLLGPRGMSEGDRQAAIALCERLDATPHWRALCAANGWSRVFLGGDDFRRWLSTETGRTRGVLHELGLLTSSDTTCWGSCVRRP
ncbi:tripartite tricarboxylate transporter substrate-binding protein [Streptosporangium sp. NPDC023615]|uniref:tripartite tricarboxylate transporter substrate-binding protein n=1 Tax=Streptosporangium sp. NPDC023615 TaxID=3154794 RepID=UPI003440575D